MFDPIERVRAERELHFPFEGSESRCGSILRRTPQTTGSSVSFLSDAIQASASIFAAKVVGAEWRLQIGPGVVRLPATRLKLAYLRSHAVWP